MLLSCTRTCLPCWATWAVPALHHHLLCLSAGQQELPCTGWNSPCVSKAPCAGGGRQGGQPARRLPGAAPPLSVPGRRRPQAGWSRGRSAQPARADGVVSSGVQGSRGRAGALRQSHGSAVPRACGSHRCASLLSSFLSLLLSAAFHAGLVGSASCPLWQDNGLNYRAAVQ